MAANGLIFHLSNRRPWLLTAALLTLKGRKVESSPVLFFGLLGPFSCFIDDFTIVVQGLFFQDSIALSFYIQPATHAKDTSVAAA